MIRPEMYQVAMLALGLIVALIESLAMKRGGRRYLWISAIVLVIILSVLGTADWRGQPVKETPLTTYLLQASIPTLAVAGLIDWLSGRNASSAVLIVSGFILWEVLAFALLFTAFFP